MCPWDIVWQVGTRRIMAFLIRAILIRACLWGPGCEQKQDTQQAFLYLAFFHTLALKGEPPGIKKRARGRQRRPKEFKQAVQGQQRESHMAEEGFRKTAKNYKKQDTQQAFVYLAFVHSSGVFFFALGFHTSFPSSMFGVSLSLNCFRNISELGMFCFTHLVSLLASNGKS